MAIREIKTKLYARLNPFVGYRLGGPYLKGLRKFAAESSRFIRDDCAKYGGLGVKGRKEIPLNLGPGFAREYLPDLSTISVRGLHPTDITKGDILLALRFLKRVHVEKGKTYSIGDLRLKMEDGGASLWKTQAREVWTVPFSLWLEKEYLKEMPQAFTGSELRTLILMEIDNSKKAFKELSETYPANARISLIEAFENIGLLNHVIRVKWAFEQLTSRDPQELKRLEEASRFAFELKEDKAFYKVLLASLWLHDIGKLIEEKDHLAHSKEVVEANPDINSNLKKIFTPREIELIEFLVLNHSVITDIAIMKQRDPLPLIHAITSFEFKKPAITYEKLYADIILKGKLLKAIMLMGICDTMSYNAGEYKRLTEDKLNEVFKYFSLSESILSGKRKIETEKETADLYLDWGKERFLCWTVPEDVRESSIEMMLAYEELVRHIPNEADREDFFEYLGRIDNVSLIYDLKKEIDDPILRCRLVILVVDLMKKHEAWGCKKCFIKINRSPAAEFNRQIDKIVSILKDHPINEAEKFLSVKIDAHQKSLDINF